MLNPVGPGGSGRYLPVLWDLERDRAARSRPRPMPDDGVLLVPGALLQGIGLAFDVVVHLRVGPAARRRLTPAEQAWELPAFDRYDDEVDPAALADAVVLADHPDRPALVLAGRFAADRGSVELAGDPAVEDVPGDRHRRRQGTRPLPRTQLLTGEPPGFFDLVGVQPQGVVTVGAGHEAEHQ